VATRGMVVMPVAANQTRALAHPDGSGGGLVEQVLAVGQPGEPVHRGVQEQVSGAGAGGLGPAGGPVLGAVCRGHASVRTRQPPPSGTRPTFLDANVDHMAAVPGHDPAGLA